MDEDLKTSTTGQVYLSISGNGHGHMVRVKCPICGNNRTSEFCTNCGYISYYNPPYAPEPQVTAKRSIYDELVAGVAILLLLICMPLV